MGLFESLINLLDEDSDTPFENNSNNALDQSAGTVGATLTQASSGVQVMIKRTPVIDGIQRKTR
jgi:hypothetical protein